MLLETYSSLEGEKLLNCLPKFLNIVKEVTGDPSFSMFNLSLKEDWSKTKKFCHSLHGKDQRANQALEQQQQQKPQAYHDCSVNSSGSNITTATVATTNGTAQLNNHNNSNNHANHHAHSDCHARIANNATLPNHTTNTNTTATTPNKSSN